MAPHRMNVTNPIEHFLPFGESKLTSNTMDFDFPKSTRSSPLKVDTSLPENTLYKSVFYPWRNPAVYPILDFEA